MYMYNVHVYIHVHTCICNDGNMYCRSYDATGESRITQLRGQVDEVRHTLSPHVTHHVTLSVSLSHIQCACVHCIYNVHVYEYMYMYIYTCTCVWHSV